jgi:Flp pilus assembly protein TadG
MIVVYFLRQLMHNCRMCRIAQGAEAPSGRQRGAAAVEFALVLPLLLVLILGIIDFGLYFYDDLQLTHVARDAARYLSVSNVAEANAAIDAGDGRLVSASITSRSVTPAASKGGESTITLKASYHFLTPLPQLVGIGSTAAIDASAVMRRE